MKSDIRYINCPELASFKEFLLQMGASLDIPDDIGILALFTF